MALTATTNSSSAQSSTQSPQAAPTSNFGASTTSGGVQPGTASDLLNSQNGTKLNNPSTLPGVNLSTVSSSQPAAPIPAPAKHHINASLLGFSFVLVVAAAVLFWAASRSVKSTTD